MAKIMIIGCSNTKDISLQLVITTHLAGGEEVRLAKLVTMIISQVSLIMLIMVRWA